MGHESVTDVQAEICTLQGAAVVAVAAALVERSRRCIYCDGTVRAGAWDDSSWDYDLGIETLRQAHWKCHREACEHGL